MTDARMLTNDLAVRAGHTSEHYNLDGQNYTDPKKNIQQKNGNKCGHDKFNFKMPNFSNAFGAHKRRPHCIEEFKRRFNVILRSRVLKIMNFDTKKDLMDLIYHHSNKEKKVRRRRSERVEAMLSLTLVTLVHSLNLHKMACGYYDTQNNFHYYDYSFIVNQTGQSLARVKRAMKVLQELGYVSVKRIVEKLDDGAYRTIEVRIEMTDKAFQVVDLEQEYLTDWRRADMKYQEKEGRKAKKRVLFNPPQPPNERPEYAKNRRSGMKSIGSALSGPLQQSVPKPSYGRPTPSHPDNINTEEAVQAVLQKNPHLSPYEARRRVLAELNKPPS